MMRTLAALVRPILVPICLLISFTSMAGEKTWRTPNGDLVRIGMNKGEVIARAGPPAYSEVIGCDNYGGPVETALFYFVGGGPNKESVTLRFNGLRLAHIETVLLR